MKEKGGINLDLFEVTLKFDDRKETTIKEKIREELTYLFAKNNIQKGGRIAITSGSRGISGIDKITKFTVDAVREFGYEPFIVAAMGSHGGATAEGQLEVLHHLGITESAMGTEVKSDMDVHLLGHTPDNVPVYIDQNAYESDGIIVLNRIKVHTAFNGKIGSGLSKMVTIGLGKINGASFVHNGGAENMEKNITEVCKVALEKAPNIMGLGIVENGYDETAIIKGVHRDEWFEAEAELLNQSKEMMPQLPSSDIDVLVVEEMGKNYSGTGMDPNIIGRWRIDGVEEPDTPNIKRIVTLSLSTESQGNAQGVGLADFITERLENRIDRHATYTNALTSTYLKRAMMPLIYETDEKAIKTAVESLGVERDLSELKYVQVPNTLHLSRVYVSEKVLEDMREQNRLFDITDRKKLSFYQEGNLRNVLNE